MKYLWPALVVLMATIGTVLFECTAPLVAIAAVAAWTMDPKQAYLTTFAGWLVSQAIGFAALGYPVDQHSIGWGLAIGGAAILSAVTVVKLRSVGATILAFFVYELALYAPALAFGGTETFTLDIVSGLALINLLFFAALAVTYKALSWSPLGHLITVKTRT